MSTIKKQTSSTADRVADFACEKLNLFRKYLSEQLSQATKTTTPATNCMTRNVNETYPVTSKELRAEIIITLYLHLLATRCPLNFQMSLLRIVQQEVEHQCKNSKSCDFTYTSTQTTTTSCQSLDDDEQCFDLVKLQKFILFNFEKLLTRLTDNAEAGNLKNYAEPGTLCAEGACKCLSVEGAATESKTFATACTKNKPRKMEDRSVCIEHFSAAYQLPRPYSFYGVFDGHSGPLAACYAANQLPYLLAEQLKIVDINDVTAYGEAFEAAFLQADQFFTQKRISSGTTAVCALISHSSPVHLFIAWVGDSKALLVSPTASLQLVKSHKPDNIDERRRIECSDNGGAVMYVQGQWRVNGILNVSRSIGDYSVTCAIAEPDIVDVELTEAHDFLILATDGLWDYVDESVIIETVYTALAQMAASDCGELNVDEIVKLLINLAKTGDSPDNITVTLIFLKEHTKIVENYKKNLL